METEDSALDFNQQMQEMQQSTARRVCRLCMADDGCGTSMMGIFSNGTNMLASIIASVTQLEIRDQDGLPANICKECIDQLNIAYDFKQRCITSDVTLRKLYSQDSSISRSVNYDTTLRAENSHSLFEPHVKLETVLSCDSHSIPSEDTEDIDQSAVVDQNKDDVQSLRETTAQSSKSSFNPSPSSQYIHTVKSKNKSPLFLCNVCSKTFLHQETLIEHLHSHATEPRYKCMWCDRIFSRKDILTRHVRTHTGEQPYRCEACNKAFNQKETLVRHIRTHSGYQPYQCSTCGKAFSQKSHLNTHMWSHSQEKYFRCDVCSKNFSLKTSLNRHMRTHGAGPSFRCTACDMSFMYKATLISHMRSHTGEHPYHCEVCLMTFSLRASLTRHFRTHIQHHVYECKVCSKGFTRKDTLSRHLLTHSASNPLRGK